MFGRLKTIASALALSTAVACGGGDLEVYNNSPDGESDDQTPTTNTSSSNTTNDNLPDDAGDPNTVPVADMGGNDPPDMGDDGGEVDMSMPMDPAPTTNVPQQGPTVGSHVTASCSTIAVKGLSLQLIDQMNCLDPGVMKSFDGAPGLSYGASVFPFQQGPATDALTAVAANNAGTMPVNSALRTIPQQYLLYEWYVRGLCNANLAATPGRSNHNGGLAIDIGNSSTWRTPMRNSSYIDNVSGEPWHFYFSGAGGKDIRNLSVLAFQQLYNYNFPENRIDEDGVYGPQTEAALVASPANGFTEQPMCVTTQALIAYPHRTPIDVHMDLLGDGFIGVSALVPNGIRLVEYFVDDVLVGYADRNAHNFETVLELPRTLGDTAHLEVVAYDAAGKERGRVRGALQTRHDNPVFVRPLGGHNVEIAIDDLPNDVHHVDYFVDGIPYDQDPDLAISRDKRRRAAQLRGPLDLDVVLFDKRWNVLDTRSMTLDL